MVPYGGLALSANGLGFSSSPEALLLGELSSGARLRGCMGGSPCPRNSCFRFRDPEALPQTKQLLCPTSPSSLRDATSPSRGGFGRPLGFSSSPEALLLGELSSDSETERLYGRIPCPGSGCSRFRDPEALPQTKQLLCPTSPSSLRDATSPSRGGFGSPQRSWLALWESCRASARLRGLTPRHRGAACAGRRPLRRRLRRSASAHRAGCRG